MGPPSPSEGRAPPSYCCPAARPCFCCDRTVYSACCSQDSPRSRSSAWWGGASSAVSTGCRVVRCDCRSTTPDSATLPPLSDGALRLPFDDARFRDAPPLPGGACVVASLTDGIAPSGCRAPTERFASFVGLLFVPFDSLPFVGIGRRPFLGDVYGGTSAFGGPLGAPYGGTSAPGGPLGAPFGGLLDELGRPPAVPFGGRSRVPARALFIAFMMSSAAGTGGMFGTFGTFVRTLVGRGRMSFILRKTAPEPPPARAAAARKKEAGPGRGKPAKGFRLNGRMRKREHAAKLAVRQQYEEIWVQATGEWQSRVAAGKVGKGHASADEVAKMFPTPAGCKNITGRMLRDAVNEGRAGRAQKKRGPDADLPDELVAATAGFAELRQVAGDEQKPRQLIARTLATVKGTPFEEKLSKPSQRRHFLERVRRVEGMESSPSQCVGDLV